MTTPARALALVPRSPQEPVREPDAVEMLRAAAEALRGGVALGRTALRVASEDWPKGGQAFPPQG